MTIMSGIPLYTTKKEALAWSLANGVTGYHKHTFNNKLGYMGGATHAVITKTKAVQKNTDKNIQFPSRYPQQDRPAQINEQKPMEPMRPQVTQQTRPQPQTQQTQRPVIRTTQPFRRTSTGGGTGGGGY